MRFRLALSMATCFLVCFTLTVWRPTAFIGPQAKTAAVSGRIASVGETEFSLDCNKNQEPRKLKFLIDSETRMEGKLAIDANAAVDHRSSDGTATHVVALADSGLRP